MRVSVTSKAFSKNAILVKELKEQFEDIELNDKGIVFNDDELIDYLKNADAAVIGLENINKYVIDRLPNLKMISKFGVGLDSIDLTYCEKKKIKIGWSSGVNRQSVAEMTLGFMLMLIRNLYLTSNQLKSCNWNKDGGFSLYGKKIGIIGVGNIGKELIKLLEPFGCEILVNDIALDLSLINKKNIEEASKEEIFQKVDILTIHTPLTIETKDMVNKHSLNLMKSTAFVINTARGGIVNLVDLERALRSGQIAGAALDVYDYEPFDNGSLLSIENLVCTPHIGGNSAEAVLAMGRSAIKHLVGELK